MPLPLPNLDDRRWQDLTQEGIALIPRYAPQWTDFNTHDPGITLVELFAFLTESLVYRLNLIPDRFRWKFLSLIGYRARGPRPSHTVLVFGPLLPGTHIPLSKRLQFIASGRDRAAVLFSTARDIDISTVTLSAIQGDDGSGAIRDYSRDYLDGLPVAALGLNPVPGAALYLGFQTIPLGVPIAVWFWFTGAHHDANERRRILAEPRAQREACRRYEPGWPCNGAHVPSHAEMCDHDPEPVPPHHSVKVVWEVFAGGAWTALDPVPMPARPAAGQIVDDTRSLTLDGLVEFNLPIGATPAVISSVPDALVYVRCRLAAGAYDAPVVVVTAKPNAVAAVQHVPVWQRLTIAGTVLPAAPPVSGQSISLQFTVAADLTVESLAVQSPPAGGQPGFELLGYVAPAGGHTGSITMEFAIAGIGTAVPSQEVVVPGAPVEDCCFRLYTHDGINWTAWERVTAFDAAKRGDWVYTLDSATGIITCGDGERGQVFPQDSVIVAACRVTVAEKGNALSRRIQGLASTPANTVLLASVSDSDRAVLSQSAFNPVPATGGAPTTALTELEGEAAEVVHARERILDLAAGAHEDTLDQIPKSSVLGLPAPSQAVTLLDTERIVLDVPGAAIARARAWSNTDPGLPGIHATGVMTVVILPDMPIAQPMPSSGLIAATQRYLERRRVLCTRLAVTAPTYVVITITAEVQAASGAKAAAVLSEILAELKRFLDPLTGGPAGLGWPFGRDVFRAEILSVIGSAAGVDHVDSMSMTADSGAPECGDIPLCPAFLVSSGSHQIRVVAS